MNLHENKRFSGGSSGARSRDLRIKRPHGQSALKALFYGLASLLEKGREPTVNHAFQKAHFDDLYGARVSGGLTPRPPVSRISDPDVFESLRGVTS